MRKMMSLLIIALLLAFSATAFAKDVYVKGYTRKDGTYVQPHYRSAPDKTPLNNYSTRGNTNPHTGQPGYKDPYANSYGNSYGNPYGSKRSY